MIVRSRFTFVRARAACTGAAMLPVLALLIAAAPLADQKATVTAGPVGAATGSDSDAHVPIADIALVDRALFRVEIDGSVGSGFLFRSNGYVLTNRHVVDLVPIGGTIRVRPVKAGADGAVAVGEPFVGTLRCKHPDLDVAVIEIPVQPTHAVLRPSQSVEEKHAPRGLELWAHGFPDMGSPTISRGMLSAHFHDPITGEILYLTDTALAPGSSGGPVTDARGGVVGIATAAHIVEGGAGTSWGYVLPIRSVEKALSCELGFEALPTPFDATKWQLAVRGAPTPLASIQQYAEAVKDATSRCASPWELTDALIVLDGSLAAASGRLERDDFQAFIRLFIDSCTAIDARYFEFEIRGESGAALRERRRYTDTSRLALDSPERLGMILGDVESPEGLARFGHFLGSFAAEAMKLVASAESACTDLKAAWAALEDDGPTRRADVRRHARALSDMTQALNTINSLDPAKITLEDPELSPEVRRSLQVSKATLENLLDRWSEIPPECRNLVEELDATLSSDRGGGSEADGGEVDFDSILDEWTNAGWTRWGDTQRRTAEGSGHVFNVHFDEPPSIVYAFVYAKGSRGLELVVRDASARELELLDEAVGGGIGLFAIEAEKQGKLIFNFNSENLRDFPFEFAVLHRPTSLGRMRDSVRRAGLYLEEIGPRTFLVPARESRAFKFSADEWAGFILIASEGMGEDIDLRILDPEGNVVASDDEADSLPICEVDRAVRGSYSLEIINPTERTVTVDTLLVGRRRQR